MFLNDEELAIRWGLSKKRVAHMRVAGDGPLFVKLGDAKNAPVRYPLEHVEEFEREHAHKSTAEYGASAA